MLSRTAAFTTAASAAARTSRFAPLMSTRFSSSSEGATGSGFSRPGGEHSGDSFTKREKAAEDLYIRQQEQEKFKELRKKLKLQRQHLDDLDKHLDELTREQGGEKN